MAPQLARRSLAPAVVRGAAPATETDDGGGDGDSMTRRWARLVFLQSTASCHALPPPRVAMLFRRRRCFSSSSADGDHLFGLADSDFSPPAAPDRLLSPKDFAFLNEPSPEPPREFSDGAVAICEALMEGGGSGIDAKTEKSLRQFRGKLNELVIEVLKGLKGTELCVKFFVWAGRGGRLGTSTMVLLFMPYWMH